MIGQTHEVWLRLLRRAFVTFAASLLCVVLSGMTHGANGGTEVSFHELETEWSYDGAAFMAWSDSLTDGSPFTVRATVEIQPDGMRFLDTIRLINVRDITERSLLFGIVWEKDTAGWGLGWKLNLIGLSPVEATAQDTEERDRIVVTTVGTPIPRQGHTYEITLSYDPNSGALAFRLVNATENRLLASGSEWMVKESGDTGKSVGTGFVARSPKEEPPIMVKSIGQLAHYLPLDIAWTVGSESTTMGPLLPRRRFDLDEEVTIDVAVPYVPSQGRFHVRYVTEHAEVLLGEVPGAGERRLRIPAASLPIGSGSVYLEYVEDDQVLFTDVQKISIGSIEVQIDTSEIIRQGNNLHGHGIVTASGNMGRMPLALDVDILEWVWDPLSRSYRRERRVTRSVLDTTVDIKDDHSTNVPFTIPLPEQPGNWELNFYAQSSIEVNLHAVGNRRLFATGADDFMDGSRQGTPSTVKVCTYNMLGFRGWPENIATLAIGVRLEKRLDHFASVLRELDCDVLGIQEGWSIDWLGLLAREVDNNVARFSTPTSFPGAIMTRYPILAQRDYALGLRTHDVPFSRTAGASLLDINGVDVWVVNIHAHPNQQESREIEAVVLANEIDELMEESPHIIVLGDFNSPVGTVLHETLRERGFMNTMELAGGGVAHTMTNREGVGVLAIDHIYVSEVLLGKVRASWVVSDPGFRLPLAPGPDDWVHSDHLPVVAEIEW